VVAREGPGGAAFSYFPRRPLGEHDVSASTHLVNAQPTEQIPYVPVIRIILEASLQNSDM